MKENYEYKLSAKEDLVDKWGLAIAVTIIAWLITSAFTGNAGRETFNVFWKSDGIFSIGSRTNSFGSLFSLISFLVTGPINLGLAVFFIHITRKETAEINDMFSGFQIFLAAFLTNFFIVLFTVLWSLLFLIPGIIASISYSMTYYILQDQPELSPLEAIAQSKALMRGHKMDFFILAISFVGWFLLSLITFGLGFLYLLPYYNATKAHFYNDLISN
ncbi:DUF975 family protein [Fusibacter bizertensis]|uniref:DUF975 family protein n=1 Tax=Fusibacter bizertensis TaxID=1488331 RepID=A0ABT6NDE3_9FIRM|nr:DUF975 family protein [Fusibacter bizertensis]MDH8678438.1 DUF975 family protein [Fusibacter bizertensis]